MKVAVWNYYTFSYVGSYEIAGDFSPSWDLLSPQNSVMKIAGDCVIEKMMIVACPVSHGRTFIGIVRDVKKNSAGITEVTAQEILSILDIPIINDVFSASEQTNGPCEWLRDKAKGYFIDSNDVYQNLPWLTLSYISGAAQDSPAWSSNETSTLLSALEEFIDAYDAVVLFSLSSNNTRIECTFTYSSSLTKYIFDLRTDAFSDVSFSDNAETAVNKVVFKPMTDNYINTANDYAFVLLSDGTISTDLNDIKRITPVTSQIEFYSDEDLGGTAADPSNLAVSATEILNVSKYSHEVKFKMRYHKASSYLQAAFAALCCGMAVTLYGIPGHETEAIDTKVTRVQVTGEDELEVTCGYSRSQLTDKIKMRNRIDKGGKRLTYGLVSAEITQRFSRELDGDNDEFYIGSTTFDVPDNAVVQSIEVYATSGVSMASLQRVAYSDHWSSSAGFELDSDEETYPIQNPDGTVTHSIDASYPVSDWYVEQHPRPNVGPFRTYYLFYLKVTYVTVKTISTNNKRVRR